MGVSVERLIPWIQALLAAEGKPAGEISLTFADRKQMVLLNEQYTDRKGTTDVLAFSQQEGAFPAPDPDLLGDVIVDVSRVQEQACEYGTDPAEELLRVVAHGVLHLLGYDHKTSEEEKIMKDAEESHLRAYVKKARPQE